MDEIESNFKPLILIVLKLECSHFHNFRRILIFFSFLINVYCPLIKHIVKVELSSINV